MVEEERKSKIAAAISSSADTQNKEKNGTDDELSQSISIVPGEFQKSSFDDDIGSNNSGYYELKVRFSLITIRLWFVPKFQIYIVSPFTIALCCILHKHIQFLTRLYWLIRLYRSKCPYHIHFDLFSLYWFMSLKFLH